jgi:IMP dehydrogenase
MKEYLSFDDILIEPMFSTIKSRKDVNTNSFGLKVPVISSNMDTVTGPDMCSAMADAGGVGCLHRFSSIEDNIKMYRKALLTSNQLIKQDDDSETWGCKKPWVSIGLGSTEFERAKALYNEGADTFVIDVAHGASMEVVNQFVELCKLVGENENKIIVGNFATAQSIKDFIYHAGFEPDAVKVGIGGGSACLTRVVTGCGAPTLGSILDCANVSIPIIADGGIRNSGDFAKAIAAGASAVMVGRLFAGCDESPGEVVSLPQFNSATAAMMFESEIKHFKKYRGSASAESYAVQNKISEWRTAEGDSYLIPHTGPVKGVMQQLEAGLRSAMSYVGTDNIADFQLFSQFIRITNSGAKENGAHGKNNS